MTHAYAARCIDCGQDAPTTETKRTTTLSIDGMVTGGLWWPIGAPAAKDFSAAVNVEREGIPHRGPIDDLVSIVRAEIESEGGDFSTAVRLCADAVIEVRHHWRAEGRTSAYRTRGRLYSAADVPSLVAADLVAVDTYSSDFSGQED